MLMVVVSRQSPATSSKSGKFAIPPNGPTSPSTLKGDGDDDDEDPLLGTIEAESNDDDGG
jgi:hypothetical protein